MRKVIVIINPPNKQLVMRDMYSSTVSKGLYNWPNADLLAISGNLRDDFDVHLIDANSEELSFENALNKVVALNPMGVVSSFGVSVREEDYAFASAIKETLSKVQIVGTGGFLYHNSKEELKEHQELDAILLNYVTDDILKFFKGDFENLNNFTYRKDGQIIQTPKKMPAGGFKLKNIPLHQHLPLHRYRLSHGKQVPLSSVVTSYGCPAKCSFCVSGKINYSYRDPANIIEELHFLKRLGIKEIFFRDNWFGANQKHREELLRLMIKEKFGFSWVTDTRANTISDESVKLMKKSGCHALHMGVESANEETLKTYNKNLTLDTISNAFKICHEAGIITVGYFIIGLPGETREDAENTINFAIDLDCDFASFNMAIPIIGTKLRDSAVENNLIDQQEKSLAYDGSATPVLGTKKFSSNDILNLRNQAYKKFYLRWGFILKTLKRTRNLYQLKMLLLEFYRMISNKGI